MILLSSLRVFVLDNRFSFKERRQVLLNLEPVIGEKTALIILKEYDGEIPNSHANLQALPGVGSYTASAVKNFAFRESVSLVDGNVIHFISRVYGIRFAGPTDIKAWEFMSRVGGQQDARLYWGIIDLVATICLKKNPRCSLCPLSGICDWFSKSGTTSKAT